MANNLIENKTEVHYTVVLQGCLYIKDYSMYGGKVENILAVQDGYYARKFDSKDTASKVAKYANGKAIKHTRTTVVTEVTEEIEVI